MSVSSGGAGNVSNSSRFTTPQSRTSRIVSNGPPQPPTTTMTTATSHPNRSQPRSASVTSSGVMAQQAQQLSATPIKAQHYQPPTYGRLESCKHVTFGKNGGTSRRGFTLGTKSYAEIRRDCLDKGVLWQDADFPALDESVFFTAQPPKPFDWQRPHEIVAAPKFFVDGASRFDVSQGELGDCWFLAAVANLVTYKELFTHVVPDDQSFELGEYCGAFRFIFWRFGEWVEVIVDDRLPTFHGRLLFMHSTEQSEFWSALLEKAYAKLHGSYEQLKGGSTSEAMEDFTGGLTEYYSLRKAPENLYKIMQKANERKSLMGCSIDVPESTMIDFKMPNGLMAGHAYSITAVKAVTLHTSRVSGRVSLLRLRNPWGNQHEWKGAWSDKSSEWRSISEGDRQKLDITFEEDGEFWMSYEDFLGNFSKLEICNLGAESLEREHQHTYHHHHPQTYGGSHSSGSSGSGITPIMRRVRWETQIFEGSWTRGVTAGGCRNYLNTFPHNPQYEIRLTEPDDEDEEEQLCTCVVALLQKSRPRGGATPAVVKESIAKGSSNPGSGEIAEAGKQNEALLDYNTIGFAIYYLKNPDNTPRPLPLDYFRYNTSIARSPTFINLREVTARFRLPVGTYCIIPSTFESNLEGDFLLRVFSEKAYPMHEYDDKVGLNDRIPQAVPANVRDSEFNAELKQAFTMLAGNTKEITYKQLQMILNSVVKKYFKFTGFSTEACRSMVAMLDRDCTGRLGFDEFLALWVNIRLWKSAFTKFDRNRSGSLDAYELRALLHHVGYTINWRTLRFIVLRFAGSGDGGGGAGGSGSGEDEVVPGANSNTAEVTISFEDFILAATKLKTIIDHFCQHCDSVRNNAANAVVGVGATPLRCTFTLDEFVENAIFS